MDQKKEVGMSEKDFDLIIESLVNYIDTLYHEIQMTNNQFSIDMMRSDIKRADKLIKIFKETLDYFKSMN